MPGTSRSGRTPMRTDNLSDATAAKRSINVDIVNVTEPIKVTQPDLGFDAHPLAQDLWDSLSESAQAMFYEPSDWQVARVACYVLNQVANQGMRINGSVLASLNQMFQGLMLTEESRRRAHIEVRRGGEEKSIDEQLAETIQEWAAG